MVVYFLFYAAKGVDRSSVCQASRGVADLSVTAYHVQMIYTFDLWEFIPIQIYVWKNYSTSPGKWSFGLKNDLLGMKQEMHCKFSTT